MCVDRPALTELLVDKIVIAPHPHKIVDGRRQQSVGAFAHQAGIGTVKQDDGAAGIGPGEKSVDVSSLERDHISYRLADHPALNHFAPLVQWPVSSAIACEMFRRLGGLVIRARRMPA